MRRFFVDGKLSQGQELELAPTLAHRLASVLRLRAGEKVLLVNGSGLEYETELLSLTPRAARGRVLSEHAGLPEPAVRLTLYQALIKAARFDSLLEHATELGVAEIVPVISARSVVRPGEGSVEKQKRWQRIVLEAAEQCGRARPPRIQPPLSFAEAIAAAKGLVFFPWEGESTAGLGNVLAVTRKPPQEVSIFIGPEGGFTDEEAGAARRAGAQLVSLGERILRSETAALATIAIVMHALGDLRGQG